MHWVGRETGTSKDKDEVNKREVFFIIFYYESMKRKLKPIKPIYECRCNGRLQTKRFTRLAHTGLVVELEHLKIETRLIDEMFPSFVLFIMNRLRVLCCLL